MAVSGSLRKVLIGGVSYDVASDVSAEFKPSRFEKENMATSGDNLTKYTLVSQDITGIDLVVPPLDKDVLQLVVDSTIAVPVSLTLADDSVFAGIAHVNAETWSTEELRQTISLLPVGGIKPWIKIA